MKLLLKKGDAFQQGKIDGYGEITLVPEETEDLWHTYNLIAKGDRVLATTWRKVQKESSTGSVDSQKVKMLLAIAVKSVDFDPEGGTLRVNGTIMSEHEGIRLGSHHTLELELNRKYTLAKTQWDRMYMEIVATATGGPVQHADVAAVLMHQGLCNLCLVSGGMTVTRARLECHIPTKGNAAVQQGAKKDRERWYEQILRAVLMYIDYSVVKCDHLACDLPRSPRSAPPTRPIGPALPTARELLPPSVLSSCRQVRHPRGARLCQGPVVGVGQGGGRPARRAQGALRQPLQVGAVPREHRVQARAQGGLQPA